MYFWDIKKEPKDIGCGTEKTQGVKVITSRDVIFNESVFPCRVPNNNAGTSSQHVKTSEQTDSTQFEVESTRQQEPETNTDEPEYETEHTTTNTEPDGEDESEENIDNDQQNDLAQYQLARDRTRRDIRPPARFSYADLIYTALLAGVEIQRTEPDSYE